MKPLWPLVLFAALGCAGSERTLVGLWAWENPAADTDVGYRFNADGTYTFWYRGNQAKLEEMGTWVLQGDTLTLVPDDKSAATTTGTVKWMTSKRFELKDSKGTTVWIREEP